jgi:hypothetical protein
MISGQLEVIIVSPELGRFRIASDRRGDKLPKHAGE